MATPLLVEHLGQIDSTQTAAALRFAGSPVLVTATAQDAGRGRSGAGWLNADRSLAASLAFRSDWHSPTLPRITLVAGLAALDVLPPRVGLKWPNDVMVGDDKVGGILTEVRDGVVLVGFGLNVFWKSPPAGMGAMHRSDPGAGHVREIAEAWGRSLLDRLETGPDDWGREEYAQRCTTIGSDITWEPAGAGRAVGIGSDGTLAVETSGGLEHLRSGAVSEVRRS